MDPLGQMEWDLLKSLNADNHLSDQQYEQYLKILLNNYGLILIGRNETFEDIFLYDEMESIKSALNNCQLDLIKLRKQLNQQ